MLSLHEIPRNSFVWYFVVQRAISRSEAARASELRTGVYEYVTHEDGMPGAPMMHLVEDGASPRIFLP